MCYGSMPCDDVMVLVDSTSALWPGDRAEPGWTTGTVVAKAKAKSKNMQRPLRMQECT